MKKWMVVAGILVALPLAGEIPPSWTEPVEPFRIIGNVYYVGTAELSSYLITGSKGHVLLDAPMEENVDHLLRSIRALGFDPADIEIMINSHGHFDHAGGFARMKKETGARLLVSKEDADLIERGGRGPFSFGESSHFSPASVDRFVRDGEIVSLGDLRLEAMLTPGHTMGGTSWLLEASEKERSHRVLFANSMSAVYPLSNNEHYPSIMSDFRASFDRLGGLEADVFLSTHGSFFELDRKRKELSADSNPFLDREESKRFVERWRAIVEKQFAAARDDH